MSKRDSNKNRLVATLRRQPTDRVPIFEHVIDRRFIQHAIGVDTVNTLALNPEDHLRLMTHIGMDVATFGYKWQIKGLTCRQALENAQEPDHHWLLDKVDRYLDVLRGTDVGLNVYVHGPLDVTYLSLGYENFFAAVHEDPAFVEAAMEKFTVHTIRVVEDLLKKDLTMLYVADDIAFGQGLMMHPKYFERWWLPRMERIIRPIRQRNIPCVYHSDGKTDEFLPWIIDLGFNGITAIEPQCNDIRAIKKKYGDQITLFGNMDIAGPLAFGTPQDVVREVKKLLEDLAPGGGYVAMSANSITDGIIPENYEAMIDTVMAFGQYTRL